MALARQAAQAGLVILIVRLLGVEVLHVSIHHRKFPGGFCRPAAPPGP